MAKKPDHSPLPWNLTKTGAIVAPDGWEVGTVFNFNCGQDEARQEARQNGRLIVRAANAHYNLLERLKDVAAIIQATYGQEEYGGKQASGADVVDMLLKIEPDIKNAIATAGGAS